MCLEDYMEQYETTSLCMNLNYKLSEKAFKVEGKPSAFFQFELSEKLNLAEQFLIFMSNQMGNRLG
jgi:hypothetical protein